MTVIFCEIGYLNYYNGESDEIYANNFLDFNGYCYGNMIHKPQIAEDFKEDVFVIFIGKSIFESDNVIIGFYKDATIYSQEQVILDKYSIGKELHYYAKAISENCFLIPNEHRNYVVTDEMKNDVDSIMNILVYLDSIDFKRANLFFNESALSAVMPENALSYNELMDAGENEIENENFYKALVYFNTAFTVSKNIDAIFNIASMLECLYCFDKSIQVFEKLRELEGDEVDTLDNLQNLYLQTKQYDKAMEICDTSIKFAEEEKDMESICGLLCIKSDIFVQLNEVDNAIKCLDFIIKNSNDELMVSETKACREKLVENKDNSN